MKKTLCFTWPLLLGLTVWGAGRDQLPGPLFANLGDLHHPVTTTSSRAQRYFDQGLLLLYGFNHPEAIRSFRSAAQLDPRCAMAYWGVAYAYGPHVNRPMTAEDTAAAWAALQEAVVRKPGASPRERAYLGALEQRYRPQHSDERGELDRAFADAMRRLVQEYPDDVDAQTLFAEALMNTMPWDYWAGDRSPRPETEEALAALRTVLARQPDHPGANHLFIHAVEAGPNPELGLPSADRLRFFAPGAGHLVHMPSHIYMRVGQYRDATLANERAVKADREYLRSCRAQGFYPGAYYPHNLHFLWWAQLFEGRSAEALRTAKRVATYASDNSCGPNQAVEAPRLRHLPWLTMARFGQWNELLAVPEPAGNGDYLVDRVLWHFTRGLALVATGEAEAAAAEHAALVRWADSEAARKLDSPAFPVSRTLAVPRHWLAAKVAGARGDTQGSIQHLERAVAAEDELPYMEPTFWPVPVRPALGAAWLQAGEAARAEAVFREDLERVPRNPWGLLGLEVSLRSQAKVESAALVRREFARAWQHADTQLELDWF